MYRTQFAGFVAILVVAVSLSGCASRQIQDGNKASPTPTPEEKTYVKPKPKYRVGDVVGFFNETTVGYITLTLCGIDDPYYFKGGEKERCTYQVRYKDDSGVFHDLYVQEFEIRGKR